MSERFARPGRKLVEELSAFDPREIEQARFGDDKPANIIERLMVTIWHLQQRIMALEAQANERKR